jgi:hypothetical protein
VALYQAANYRPRQQDANAGEDDRADQRPELQQWAITFLEHISPFSALLTFIVGGAKR